MISYKSELKGLKDILEQDTKKWKICLGCSLDWFQPPFEGLACSDPAREELLVRVSEYPFRQHARTGESLPVAADV